MLFHVFGSSGIVSFIPLWEEPVGVPFLRYIITCAARMFLSLGLSGCVRQQVRNAPSGRRHHMLFLDYSIF